MPGWMDLTFPADARYVGVARTMAVAAAATCALDGERVQDVRTCVSEAVTNAVNAHIRSGTSEPVRLRVRSDEQDLRIEVHDRGPGMPGEVTPAPSTTAVPDDIEGMIEDAFVATLTEGGYGLPVMRSLADDVDLGTGEGGTGTVIRLRFDVRTSVDG